MEEAGALLKNSNMEPFLGCPAGSDPRFISPIYGTECKSEKKSSHVM